MSDWDQAWIWTPTLTWTWMPTATQMSYWDQALASTQASMQEMEDEPEEDLEHGHQEHGTVPERGLEDAAMEDEPEADLDSDLPTCIDTAVELVHTASSGLSLLGSATQDLQERFAHVKECLYMVIKSTEQSNARCENQFLEIRAARCLSHIDTVLRQMRKMEAPPLHPDAMAHLRSLQQHMQDIVVLLCSRFMDQALLQKRGMPQVLISRLEAAFTIEGIQDNLLWCRLGDSKSHIFRKEMRSQPYRIPRRRGRARRTKLEASSSTRPAMARSPSPTRPVPTRPAAGHLPDDDASREPLAATGLSAYVLMPRPARSSTRPAAASSPSASGVVYHTGGLSATLAAASSSAAAASSSAASSSAASSDFEFAAVLWTSDDNVISLPFSC